MTKLDIYSGFLGAGKTTLIKKLIKEAYAGQKIVLIENEFGEIGIDGGFLKEAGIEIREMNSGCICCSLFGDFRKALVMVLDQYAPDRIVIEPTGVGELSTIVEAAVSASDKIQVCGLTTVVDVTKFNKYSKNFGEFFNDQLTNARVVILSRTATAAPELIESVAAAIKEKNPDATVITANWDDLNGTDILEIIEGRNLLQEELLKLVAEHEEDDDDDDECDDPNCSCHHHHDDDDEDAHEHHHHHHDDEDEHEHHHHHHHHDDDDDDDDECDDPNCSCHHHHDDDDEDEHEHHHHHHHHHHDADDVFTSWGRETAKRYQEADIEAILKTLDSGSCGQVLRAKGIVDKDGSSWLHFDFTPGEIDIRTGAASPTGMVCVIGAGIDEEKIAELFGIK